MENNLPVIAKRIWNLVRVAYFLLRKGISKSKLNLLHLNLLMKRGKIAGKAAFSNLMFHHHYHAAANASNAAADGQLPFAIAIGPDQYEFSCSDSPTFLPAFFHRRRNHNHNQNHNSFFACAHAPDTLDDDAAAVKAVVEILNDHGGASSSSPPSPSPVPASPALPGFGRTPRRVRQLRITDSPFPLQDANADPLVDKAADEFISRFYKELRLQKTADEN